MENKVVRIFLDADLRCQHNGLEGLARKHKVKIGTLKPNEHVLFVNSKRDKVKMYSPNGVLGYYRSSRGRLDVRALGEIPRTYGKDLEVKYNKALKKVLEKEFQKKA